MKKIVLTFGFISGVIISVLMSGSILLSKPMSSGRGMALGYTIMVASFLLVYFGIRSYRDNILGGRISFGRALGCGLLITAITCACYVVTWEIVFFKFMSHSMDGYFAAQVRRVQTSGVDPSVAAAKIAAIRHSQQLYLNPFVNMAYTLIEPLPVGVVITLVSAALLRRKELLPSSSSSSSPAASVA